MISGHKKVIVGMSGGLDSSLTACVLKEEGYQPIGITLSLWEGGSRCCSEKDVSDARRVCQDMGIPHYTVCHSTRFNREVVDYFVSEYAIGRTPNPCVVCNERVKFKMLLSKAMEVGAHHIATGHYARVDYDQNSGSFLLRRGADRTKDQSYFLARLPQKMLRRVLLPMGPMSKDQARTKAEALSLHVSSKAESQEVCFLKKGEQSDFLRQRIGQREGPIVAEGGEVIGTHSGIYNYTLGQRKGLGVSRGHPLYVTSLDPDGERVFVGTEDSLLRRRVLIDGLRLLMPQSGGTVEVHAKIRYGSPPQKALFFQTGQDTADVVFETPQRAVTPGQLLVAYVGDAVYASGWIRAGN
jgi:tRNA-specific 2-thiouridylase